MDGLCAYKDSLGKPGEGLHAYRFAGIAVVDVLLTVLLAALVSYSSDVKFLYALIILFILGIFMHRLFCVRTTVDQWLVPDCKAD